MYGIFTYIYHKNQPSVGKYTIHGSSGIDSRIACSLGTKFFFGEYYTILPTNLSSFPAPNATVVGPQGVLRFSAGFASGACTAFATQWMHNVSLFAGKNFFVAAQGYRVIGLHPFVWEMVG